MMIETDLHSFSTHLLLGTIIAIRMMSESNNPHDVELNFGIDGLNQFPAAPFQKSFINDAVFTLFMPIIFT